MEEAAVFEAGNIEKITQDLSTVRMDDFWQKKDLQSTLEKHSQTKLDSSTEATDQPATFQYGRLDLSKGAVRLIRVLPGVQSEVIQCELLHYTPDDCPPFTALSYTWDHDAQYERIECNGMSMPIMKNLFRFLVQFRSALTVERLSLWVDAICINQQNVDERNHQVGQMRDIYTRADSVIVWLAESDDEADVAFGILKEQTQLLNSENSDCYDLRRHIPNRKWKALQRLLNRP
jgi:hypothetical protein